MIQECEDAVFELIAEAFRLANHPSEDGERAWKVLLVTLISKGVLAIHPGPLPTCLP